MKKYLVIGGPVRSSYDGDIHQISPLALCMLYGVNPKECILTTITNVESDTRGLDRTKFKTLRPRADGLYQRD